MRLDGDWVARDVREIQLKHSTHMANGRGKISVRREMTFGGRVQC